jgi:phytoene dehydrogenase-like protein
MSPRWDAIVIGAGHNGLVAANYLARAGRKVLVLERRSIAGGQLVTETLRPGLSVDSVHASGWLRPDIVRDLGLPALPAVSRTPAYVALREDGPALELDSDARTPTHETLRRWSARDAARWPEFVAFLDSAANWLDAVYRTPLPRLPRVSFRSGLPLAALWWKLRRLGSRDQFRVLRALSMSAEELTGEWFETEAVRAAVAALAIHGVTLGPMSAGTGLTLIHNWLNRGGLAHRSLQGGVGVLSRTLVTALERYGGVLRTDAEVMRICIERQRVCGVMLHDGEEIRAPIVLSALDPRRTFLSLVGAAELPPEFVWQVQSIKLRGSVAKIHVATDGRHGLPAGTSVIAPSLCALERAYDAAKYGAISEQPYLEIHPTGSLVSIHFQFAPYAGCRLAASDSAALLERRAFDLIERHVPGFRASVRTVYTLTPQELESRYGVSEGDLNHGQLLLDQMFFLRPLPGWSDHCTPIDGLYLCGSGAHGGGGISGAAGRNAARAVLRFGSRAPGEIAARGGRRDAVEVKA